MKVNSLEEKKVKKILVDFKHDLNNFANINIEILI